MLGRILFAWTVAVFASVAFASDLSDVDLATVPQCGLLCIVETVSKSSCDITDFPCICANAPLNAQIEACFAKECTPREALTTAKIAKGLCNVPIRNRSLAAWLVPLVTVILSTSFYFLRLLSRFILHQNIDAADVILGVAVAATGPVLWIAFKLVGYGLGQDVWEIPQDNITKILYLYWWAEILYQIGLPLTRISILCFYLRVFPQVHIRYASWGLIGLNVANLVAFVLVTVFQCYPVYGAWTFWDGTFTGHCNNIHVQSWAQAAINIFMDLVVVILPLPALAKLTASTRKKIQIMIMFSVGFFVTIISIIRLKTLVVFANSTNLSYDYVEPGLYSIVEASISIVVCCLPAVRALLSTTMPKIFATTVNRSVFSSGRTPKNDSSNQKFNRLKETDNSSGAGSCIRVKEEWSVQSTKMSKSESDVELMPMKLGLNLGEAQDAELHRNQNWSRPLPRGRESSLNRSGY